MHLSQIWYKKVKLKPIIVQSLTDLAYVVSEKKPVLTH